MDGPSACLSFTFAVEKITGVTVDDENNAKYEVQWAPSWVRSCNLRGCEKLIEEFLQQQNMPHITYDVKEEPSEDSGLTQGWGEENNWATELDFGDDSLPTSTSCDQQLQGEYQAEHHEKNESGIKVEENKLEQQQQPLQPQLQCHQLQQNQTHNQQHQHMEQSEHSPTRQKVASTGDVKKIHQCEECGKDFPRHWDLIRHSRTHTGDKPFLCQVCDKSFAFRSDLAKHSRIHTGVLPYTCTVCNQSFTQNSNLQRHLLIHSGEKLFSCTVCGKSFREKGHLKRHTMLHTGERPHVCILCGEGFIRRNQLNEHMVKH